MPICTLTPHEQWVLARAAHYTACAFRGRDGGGYETLEYPSWAEARQAALAMADDRPAMVYAVYRTHQALIETCSKGETLMPIKLQYHLITKGVAGLRVQSFSSEQSWKRECDKYVLPAGAAVARQEDLKPWSNDDLVAIRNHLSPKKVIRMFQSKEKGIASVWSLLTTREEPEEMDDKKTEAGNPLPMEPGHGTDDASQTTQPQQAAEPQEDGMAKTKTKRATKPKTSNGHDEFGLRKGSKSSVAAAMFARESGATMQQAMEKTESGTFYQMLKKLAEAGHKVKKEDGKIFLTAKR